jgi:hypothetical protein
LLVLGILQKIADTIKLTIAASIGNLVISDGNLFKRGTGYKLLWVVLIAYPEINKVVTKVFLSIEKIFLNSKYVK